MEYFSFRFGRNTNASKAQDVVMRHAGQGIWWHKRDSAPVVLLCELLGKGMVEVVNEFCRGGDLKRMGEGPASSCDPWSLKVTRSWRGHCANL